LFGQLRLKVYYHQLISHMSFSQRINNVYIYLSLFERNKKNVFENILSIIVLRKYLEKNDFKYLI